MARRYKRNRISRKGMSSYDIYMRKRQALEDKGFNLRPALNKEEFDKLYANARKAGIPNFFRDLTNAERYTNKPQYNRMRKGLRELESDDEEINRWKNELLNSISFEDFKSWDNEAWSAFMEIFIASGGTWDEARGIYES